jgi:hypothetical protein
MGITSRVSTRSKTVLVAVCTLLFATLLVPPAYAEGPNAIQYLDGCSTNSLARNDDGSTGRVTLPFSLNYFGVVHDSLFVNNNGNVTFNGPLSTYTPFPIETTGTPIIAPFFGDVDTRSTGSDIVRYGATTMGGRPAFCVLWAGVGVGYYAGHADRLNSFQLLLVDRSDVGPGDFDIYFNYDKIQWETGDASGGSGGTGGTPARAGFANGSGDPGTALELPGSAVRGALLDSNLQTGLTKNSRVGLQDPQDGRYLFPVRNGAAPSGGTLFGNVTDAATNVLSSAPVQACPSDSLLLGCLVTLTNAAGRYTFTGLAGGSYDLTVFPPANRLLLQATAGPINLASNATVRRDFSLTGPGAPPADTTITSVGQTSNGSPVIYWNSPLVLETDGCVGGAASYELLQGTSVIRSGSLTETPAASGHYRAEIAPLYPLHGSAVVEIEILCPIAADNETTSFDVYIDPSGVVQTTSGTPIENATVTLLRSDSESGPFTAVPDGSAIMSPSNRTNPDTTDASGHFGWDVIAGYYIVRASATNGDGVPCVSPDDATQEFVETEALLVPPPRLDLILELDCGAENEPPAIITTPITLEGNTTGGYSGPLSGVTATDPDGDAVTLTNDAPAVLALGTTSVTWTATDSNDAASTATQDVTVVDTTVPSLSCPADIGGIVGQSVTLGDATAADIVDATVPTTNDAPATFGPGTTTVLWSGTDDSENTGICSQAVTLVYRYVGFGPPVDSDPESRNAGATIPFKFELADFDHTEITSLSTVADYGFSPAGGGVTWALSYDHEKDQYILRARTPKTWAGTTKTFTLLLDDGTSHTATFEFH